MTDCGWVTTCVDVQKSCDASWNCVLLKFPRQWAKTLIKGSALWITKCDFFSQPPGAAVPPETGDNARSSCKAPGGTWRYRHWLHTHRLKELLTKPGRQYFFKWYSIFQKRSISICSSLSKSCFVPRALKARWEECSTNSSRHVMVNKGKSHGF